MGNFLSPHRTWKVGAALLTLSALTHLSADTPDPTFDIPKIDNIVIDGKADDWKDQGFAVNLMAEEKTGKVKPASDLDATFRLGWDARGLLLLVKVTDDVHEEVEGSIWNGDSIEIFYASKRGSQDILQIVASPGMDPKHPTLRWNFHDMRVSADLTKVKPTAQVVRTRDGDTYTLEALLPWANLGITPTQGTTLAFQLYVNDRDGGNYTQSLWYPISGAADSTRMYTIRLADQPSPPVNSLASANYEQLHRVEVQLTCAPGLTGQTVTVKDGDHLLGSAPLGPLEGRQGVKLTLPLPDRGHEYGPLAIALDGQVLKTVELPNLERARAEAFMKEPVAFDPSVFSGSSFPACDFENPALADDLIGPSTISTTFYDAKYQPVTSAAQPGRYGAVVKITTADGKTYRRFCTLFCMPAKISWWGDHFSGSMIFPKAAGLDPEVVKSQPEDSGKWLQLLLEDSVSRASETAAWMCGMYETKRGAAPSTVMNDFDARDRQWWVGLKRKLDGEDKLFPNPFVCPKPLAGLPAKVLHEGTLKEAGMKPDAAEKIDAVLKQWAADTDEPFAVCVARHGVIVLHKAYGTRDGKPMTVHTPSEMASNTKTMSGACIMMLVDQGLVDLDTPIDKYLPGFRGVQVAKPITLRMLYTHTAGIPAGGHNDWQNDLDDIVGGAYSTLEVGKRLQYEGTGPALGSKVVERITGESLPQFYQYHLFGPLGCTETTATDSSGNAMSTPLDMAKIAQMLLNGGSYGGQQFMRPETVEKMKPTLLTSILGPDTAAEWGIGTIWYKGEGLAPGTYGHGASSGAILRIDPADDLVIIMTRNNWGSNLDKYQPQFLQTVANEIQR